MLYFGKFDPNLLSRFWPNLSRDSLCDPDLLSRFLPNLIRRLLPIFD
jgi:hypothetical protein